MVRLTADVLLRADSYLNAYQDRELSLRGLKAPIIENLAVLEDQFDALDLSDNEIKRFGDFPRMTRLKTVLMSNNHVTRIGPLSTLDHPILPNLTDLVLTNNRVAGLGEIDALAAGCAKLQVLSLLDNPVVLRPHYRLFAIHKLPALTILDFQKVTKTEREAAAALFASAAGLQLLQEVAAAPRGGAKAAVARAAPLVLTDEQRQRVKQAIEAATSKQQIDFIEAQLKLGNFDFLGGASVEAAEEPSVESAEIEADTTEAMATDE